MPQSPAPSPLRDALEVLLREPEAEALRQWAAEVDPEFAELLNGEISHGGAGAELWVNLGLPRPSPGGGKTPRKPAEWPGVVKAWRALLGMPGADPLAPMLGPLAGAVPEEILFEAYPKALALTLHGHDLPLPAWPEFLGELREAGVLLPVGKSLAVWELTPPARWLARHALRHAEATLRETVWRVYANVCGDFATMALESLAGSTGATLDAMHHRLGHVRASLASAFDYLVARHRPARAKPLLDLLRILDLENSPLDRQPHVERLVDWAACHPQGEFCPREQCADLAKAWVELSPYIHTMEHPFSRFGRAGLAVISEIVGDEPELAAEVVAAIASDHILREDLSRETRFFQAARLYLRSANLNKAVHCLLLGLQGRERVQPCSADLDALWDLAELFIDPDAGPLSPGRTLEIATHLAAVGEEVRELLNRALDTLESSNSGSLEISTSLGTLLENLVKSTGEAYIQEMARRILRAAALKRPSDPCAMTHLAAQLSAHSGSVIPPGAQTRLYKLALALMVSTASPSPDPETRYVWARDFAAIFGKITGLATDAALRDAPEAREQHEFLHGISRLYIIYGEGQLTKQELALLAVPASALPDFLKPDRPFWDALAGLERARLLPEVLATKLASALGWDLAPFGEQLRSRAGKIRESFLGSP